VLKVNREWDNTPLYTKFDPGFSKNLFLWVETGW
jgi:hypothetical protein